MIEIFKILKNPHNWHIFIIIATFIFIFYPLLWFFITTIFDKINKYLLKKISGINIEKTALNVKQNIFTVLILLVLLCFIPVVGVFIQSFGVIFALLISAVALIYNDKAQQYKTRADFINGIALQVIENIKNKKNASMAIKVYNSELIPLPKWWEIWQLIFYQPYYGNNNHDISFYENVRKRIDEEIEIRFHNFFKPGRVKGGIDEFHKSFEDKISTIDWVDIYHKFHLHGYAVEMIKQYMVDFIKSDAFHDRKEDDKYIFNNLFLHGAEMEDKVVFSENIEINDVQFHCSKLLGIKFESDCERVNFRSSYLESNEFAGGFQQSIFSNSLMRNNEFCTTQGGYEVNNCVVNRDKFLEKCSLLQCTFFDIMTFKYEFDSTKNEYYYYLIKFTEIPWLSESFRYSNEIRDNVDQLFSSNVQEFDKAVFDNSDVKRDIARYFEIPFSDEQLKFGINDNNEFGLKSYKKDNLS